MTYKYDLDTGQGAKLNNQDISGCLFLCLKYPDIKAYQHTYHLENLLLQMAKVLAMPWASKSDLWVIIKIGFFISICCYFCNSIMPIIYNSFICLIK